MKRGQSILLLTGAVSLLLCLLLLRFQSWYVDTFGNMDFSTVLLTMMSPLQGTSASFLETILLMLLPMFLLGLAVGACLLFFARRMSVAWELTVFRRSFRVSLPPVFAVVSLLCLFSAAAGFVQQLRIPKYLSQQSRAATLYEDHYVDPKTVDIAFPKEKKNLIYIFVESLETTYADAENGGTQPVNYMPALTALAEEHLYFSDSETLGGFVSPPGATLTVGALLAQTSGVPYALAAVANKMDSFEQYMPGLTALGDILDKAGYTQEFICGSDASFAGRRKYFSQHGNYRIFDLLTAREKGYIAPDYQVFWGYEDAKLFEIAKDELRSLAAAGQPFNCTLLTVDMHHVGGYVCESCGSDYETPLANVVACNDRLITEFVAWVQAQDFYEDTVIVIAGDHPRMDTVLVGELEYYSRKVYNCFIQAAAIPQGKTAGRIFTAMDMFPTTLAALGADIEGERLGLGTNLFSERPTLAEELGFKPFMELLSRPSNYYTAAFMGGG